MYFRGNSIVNQSGPLHYVDKNSATGEFKRNTTLTENEVISLGATRLDIDYNKPDAKYKIYGWIDESGNYN